MSNLLYLGIAIGVSAIGIAWLWFRNRRPTSLEDGIEGFRRELQALAPPRRGAPPGKDGRAG